MSVKYLEVICVSGHHKTEEKPGWDRVPRVGNPAAQSSSGETLGREKAHELQRTQFSWNQISHLPASILLCVDQKLMKLWAQLSHLWNLAKSPCFVVFSGDDLRALHRQSSKSGQDGAWIIVRREWEMIGNQWRVSSDVLELRGMWRTWVVRTTWI